MSDKTVLEKATARPWHVGNWEESLANAELIVLAVNSYEESTATIRCLTELAQETVDHLEQVEDCQRCRGLAERWKAALALARRSSVVEKRRATVGEYKSDVHERWCGIFRSASIQQPCTCRQGQISSIGRAAHSSTLEKGVVPMGNLLPDEIEMFSIAVPLTLHSNKMVVQAAHAIAELLRRISDLRGHDDATRQP